MKLLIAGAFGHLGRQITHIALQKGHQVKGIDLHIEPLENATFQGQKVDLMRLDEAHGLCEGMDLVITTVGLTSSSQSLTHYDIDYLANLNLLNEAKRAGVKKFIYISVIHADATSDIPMLVAKNLFEKQLKTSGLTYTIYRPTGYFYDIAKVFKPMVDRGKVTLLRSEPVTANVIATKDFAQYIIEHLDDHPNTTYDIGGIESYTHEEIAHLFFEAAEKEPLIKYAPALLFKILARIAHLTRNGKAANIRFGQWTLTHSMEAKNAVGDASFRAYIAGLYPS